MMDQDTVAKAKRIAGNAVRLEALRKKAAQAQNLLQAAEAITAQKQRASDTRRKIIIGAIMLDAFARGTASPRSLDECLVRITRDNDRKAFEGWSLADYVITEKQASRAKVAQPDADTDTVLPPASPPAADATRTYFRVPFAQKDDARSLGMTWDAQHKLWYAPSAAIAEKAAAAFPLAEPESHQVVGQNPA